MLGLECGCQDGTTCGSCAAEPINPFTGLKPHFGMLLGVEDLQVSQGRPIGKLRLHNAWLHGGGCVWGLKVSVDERAQRQILRVDPGLALDAAGQEVYLDQALCLDIETWFAEYQKDPAFSVHDLPDRTKAFNCSIVARVRACPDRPVPAIATACEGTGADSAYSRVEERAEVFIRPRAEPPPELPYPRLRALFGLEPESPYEVDVAAIRDRIHALDTAQQPRATLEAFRQLAALDEHHLQPQNMNGRSSLFPEEPSHVVLADLIDVPVTQEAGVWSLGSLPPLRLSARRALVPSATLQELLAGALCLPGPDAGGPRLDLATVTVEPGRLSFTATSPLVIASLTTAAVSLTAFAADGWHDVSFAAERDPEDENRVHLRFDQDLAASAIVRLIVRGTGPQPVMGSNHIPLAGVLGGPPATRAEGRDVVWIKERN